MKKDWYLESRIGYHGASRATAMKKVEGVSNSADPGARLGEVEYIIAKSITRNGSVTLADWNKYWHDHKQEIETGRVQILDLPPDEAKKLADLIYFHTVPSPVQAARLSGSMQQLIGWNK